MDQYFFQRFHKVEKKNDEKKSSQKNILLGTCSALIRRVCFKYLSVIFL